MRLLKILFIALLCVFPFGEIFILNLGNDISLKPLDVISGILCVNVLIFYYKNKSLQSQLRWYYFLFPLVSLASLVINSYWLQSNELLTASLYWFRWISSMSVFFAFIQFDEKFRNKIITFLLADGIGFLIIGYLQFFYYRNLINLFYLGWDRHDYRLFSSFLDPNFTGTYFVLFLIFIVGLAFRSGKKMKRNRKIVYGLLIGLTLIALFLTYSRSALLMLLISGILFFSLLGRRKFILYLIGVISLFVIVISPYFYIENINLFRVNSSVARLDDIQNGIKILVDHPLFGVGFNAYRYAQIHYHFVPKTMSVPSHAASGVDASLIFVLATTGIIGFLTYLNLWFHLYKKALRNINTFSIIFIVSMTGLFINSFFNNVLFYPEIMFWMWIITGLMVMSV